MADPARFIRPFTSGSANQPKREERYGDRFLEDNIAEIKERREDISQPCRPDERMILRMQELVEAGSEDVEGRLKNVGRKGAGG
jgi:hypothetical protein